ncbi:uncharacterized protein LOC119306733 [Triticum dicoccoides]|uniref:uncharacterized protein LOC119306733 n=1 Tax=Triticum dicoccoides TaxID=85692 RepID=UPI00188FCB6B|nr:uncharacterized protein LOC119306733 [Triticum dicoccoides]
MEIKGENPFPNRLSFLSQCSSRSPTIRCWRCGDGVLLILTGSKCERVLGSQEIRRTAEWGNYSVLGVVFSFVLTTATCGSGNLHPHEYIFRPQLNPWRNASWCSSSWHFSCRRPTRCATLTTSKRRGASPGRAIEGHSNNNNQIPLLAPTNSVRSGSGNIVSGNGNTVVSGDNNNVSGSNNTVTSGSSNVIVDSNHVITGSNNTVSGNNNRVTGNNNVVSGSNQVVSGDNKVVTG